MGAEDVGVALDNKPPQSRSDNKETLKASPDIADLSFTDQHPGALIHEWKCHVDSVGHKVNFNAVDSLRRLRLNNLLCKYFIMQHSERTYGTIMETKHFVI